MFGGLASFRFFVYICTVRIVRQEAWMPESGGAWFPVVGFAALAVGCRVIESRLKKYLEPGIVGICVGYRLDG